MPIVRSHLGNASAINNALQGLGERMDIRYDTDRQQSVVCWPGGRPFVYFRTDGPLAVGAVLDTVRRNLYKIRNGKVDMVPAHHDDKGAGLAAELDRTFDDKCRALRPFKDDIERGLPDRTDGKGPNGGTKYYGAVVNR